MLRKSLLAACLCCAALPLPADAATLRAFRNLPGASVRLSDLFADMAAPDRVLGAAPAAGQRILVQAPQLAAIARDYGVDWRPVSGAEQTILQRASTPFAEAALLALLRPMLANAGAPMDAAVTLPDYAPPLLPVGAVPQASVADFHYEPSSYRFTAMLTVTLPDTAPLIVQLSGQVVPMMDVAVLTQRLPTGSILAADDIRAVRVPAVSLRGETAVSATAVVGLALRRGYPAGRALVVGDVMRPMLVARNATVRMVLSAGAIALSAEGTALEEGAMGAHIRVQNPNSHAVMVAEVTGADEVRIMAGHAPVVVAAQ